MKRVHNIWMHLFLLIACSLFTQCSNSLSPSSQTSHGISVNGLLSMGDDVQYLSIIETLPEYSDSIPYVFDATVEINGVPFEPIDREDINDYLDAMNWKTTGLDLTYGQVCSLKIEWQGHTIIGVTRVPDSVAPVTTRGATIFWHGDSVSTLYDFQIPEQWGERNYTGTSLNLKERYYRYEPGKYDIMIYQYDKNFNQYQEAFYSPEENPLSFGLQGAYGVFASRSLWEGTVSLE